MYCFCNKDKSIALFLHQVSKCTNSNDSNVNTQKEDQVPGNVAVYVSSIVREEHFQQAAAAHVERGNFARQTGGLKELAEDFSRPLKFSNPESVTEDLWDTIKAVFCL